MQIDHNPHERRPTNTIWWLAWAIVAALWGITFYRGNPIQWDNVLLALGTGCLIMGWAVDITGNKIPESWTRKRRDR